MIKYMSFVETERMGTLKEFIEFMEKNLII